MKDSESVRNTGSTSGLTHVDEDGEARMVDVTGKGPTVREARAVGAVQARPETIELVRTNAMAKGDVLSTARIAGILAAKRTADLIPLCHSLPLTHVELEFGLEHDRIEIRAGARTEAGTGVEMEALTAVAVAALTIYDMCKAVDRGMRIGDIRLTFKSGGRSGTFEQP